MVSPNSEFSDDLLLIATSQHSILLALSPSAPEWAAEGRLDSACPRHDIAVVFQCFLAAQRQSAKRIF
jgi:hypothetical protein